MHSLKTSFCALLAMGLVVAAGSPALAGPIGGDDSFIADFNGDDRADLLVIDGSGLLFVFITGADGISVDNGASGSPTTLPAGFSVIAATDMNGDSYADLLTQDGSGLLFVFIMNADGISVNMGASGSPSTLPAGFTFGAAADTNGDGRSDVTVVDGGGLLFTFITNADGISFDNGASGSPSTLPSGFTLQSIVDYNGDGNADTLVADAAGLLFTFISNADGISFNMGASGSPTTIPAGFLYLSSADYSADASPRADVVVVDGSGLLFIFVTNADGISFDMGASGSPTTIPSGFGSIGAADMNGDARADTIVDDAGGLVFTFISDGAASIDNSASGSPTTIPSGFTFPLYIGS